MTNKELKKLALEIYGPRRGWQKAFAEEIGVSEQTVSNWMSGRYPVPLLVQKYLEIRIFIF